MGEFKLLTSFSFDRNWICSAGTFSTLAILFLREPTVSLLCACNYVHITKSQLTETSSATTMTTPTSFWPSTLGSKTLSSVLFLSEVGWWLSTATAYFCDCHQPTIPLSTLPDRAYLRSGDTSQYAFHISLAAGSRTFSVAGSQDRKSGIDFLITPEYCAAAVEKHLKTNFFMKIYH